MLIKTFFKALLLHARLRFQLYKDRECGEISSGRFGAGMKSARPIAIAILWLTMGFSFFTPR